MSIEFQMKNRAGRVVWEYSVERSDWIVQWLYYLMGHDCKAFSQMYQAAMNDALASLCRTMREKKEFFK